MKQTCIITLLLFLCHITASAQNKLVEKYCDLDGVTCISISKAMLNVISNDDIDIQAEGMELGKIIKKLDGLQILTTEESANIKKITSELNFSKANGYTELMRIKEDDEKTFIYQKKLNETRNEFILMVTEGNIAENTGELTIIVLTGTISIQDIQQALIK